MHRDAPDLYSELLEVPPGRRPPHHYELLGLPLYCDDMPRIEKQARLQTGRAKRRAEDEDRRVAKAVENLLNQIAEARAVLVRDALRAAYDAQLETLLAIPRPAPRRNGVPSQAAPSAAAAPPPEKTVPAPRNETAPAPRNEATPENARLTAFRERLQRHLQLYKLDENEERYLMAEAKAHGLAAPEARQLIREFDRQAEQAVQERRRRDWRFVWRLAGVTAAAVALLAGVTGYHFYKEKCEREYTECFARAQAALREERFADARHGYEAALRWRDRPEARKGLEEATWRAAEEAGTLEYFLAYLGQYPNGRFALLALGRATSEIRAIQSPEALRAFLATRQKDPLAVPAREQLRQLDTEAWQRVSQRDDQDAYGEYVQEFPEGQFIDAAKNADQRAWRQTNKNDILAVESFIWRFPGSDRASEAREIAKKLASRGTASPPPGAGGDGKPPTPAPSGGGKPPPSGPSAKPWIDTARTARNAARRMGQPAVIVGVCRLILDHPKAAELAPQERNELETLLSQSCQKLQAAYPQSLMKLSLNPSFVNLELTGVVKSKNGYDVCSPIHLETGAVAQPIGIPRQLVSRRTPISWQDVRQACIAALRERLGRAVERKEYGRVLEAYGRLIAISPGTALQERTNAQAGLATAFEHVDGLCSECLDAPLSICPRCANSGTRYEVQELQCPMCNGKKRNPCDQCVRGRLTEVCGACNGSKQIMRRGFQFPAPCGQCNASGKIVKDCPECVGGFVNCRACSGTGGSFEFALVDCECQKQPPPTCPKCGRKGRRP